MRDNIFNDWKIEDVISYGKFSTIYKANKSDGSVAAVKYVSLPLPKLEMDKIISLGYAKNHQEVNNYFMNNINNEVKIMKQFNGNPYIVNCYNTHVEQSNVGVNYYVMMEYVEDLKTHYGSKVISIDDVLKIARDVCSALTLCSSINLIHGDIKPENVFLGLDGNYKLGDFSSSFNINNSCVNDYGSLNYMAPEKYNGKKLDYSSDIYSLGIMMYQLINGKLPFVSSSVDEKKAFELRMSGKELPIIKGINKNIMNIILKACSYNSSDRYKNAMDMKRDLDNIQISVSKPVDVVFSNNKKYEDTIDVNDVEMLNKYSLSRSNKNKNVSHYFCRSRFKVIFLIVILLLFLSALGVTYAFKRTCPVGYINNNGSCVLGYYYCEAGYTLNEDNKCQKTLKSIEAKISYICPTGYSMTDEDHCVSEEKKSMILSYECAVAGYVLNESTNKCELSVNAQPSIVCPNNYVAVGEKCVTLETIDATSSYGCQDTSYVLSGTKCKKSVTKEVAAVQKLVCDSGGTLNGNICDYVVSPSWFGMGCSRGQYSLSDKMCHYTASPKYSYSCNSNGVYIGNEKCRETTEDIQDAIRKYVCPSGYVVNGSICSKVADVSGQIKYYCPDSMQLRGSKCVATTPAVEIYKCPDGYISTGANCVEENIPTPVKKYICSKAYILNGDKCDKYDIVKAKKHLLNNDK